MNLALCQFVHKIYNSGRYEPANGDRIIFCRKADILEFYTSFPYILIYCGVVSVFLLMKN